MKYISTNSHYFMIKIDQNLQLISMIRKKTGFHEHQTRHENFQFVKKVSDLKVLLFRAIS